jgi:membrane protein required for colicin V production
MGILDIFLGAVLVFGLYKGIKNGLFVELASLISFFIGIYAAVRFSSFTASFISKHLSWSAKTIGITAFILTLLLVIVAVHLLAKVLSGIASSVFLGWANALAGGIFGVLKSVLLLGIVLSLFQKINFNDVLISKTTQDTSLLYHPVLKTSEVLMPFVTSWFEDLRHKAIKKEESL